MRMKLRDIINKGSLEAPLLKEFSLRSFAAGVVCTAIAAAFVCLAFLYFPIGPEPALFPCRMQSISV